MCRVFFGLVVFVRATVEKKEKALALKKQGIGDRQFLDKLTSHRNEVV